MVANGTTTAASRRATFVLLCAAVFLEACGIGALFPLLARIQAVHHLPTYSLGLMSGANFFAALGAQLGISRFLDGARARQLVVLGVALGSAGLLWFALAGDLAQLVAARAVAGAGYGIVGPAALREAASGTAGERRGARIGVLSSSMMAGITIGPVAGSVLAQVGGVATPFEVIAALLAVVLVGMAAAPREAPAVAPGAGPAGGSASAVPGGAAARGWRPGLRALGVIVLMGMATQLPNGLYDSLWSRLMTDRGASGLLIGVSLTIFGIPFVVLAPFGGRLAERRGPLVAAAIALVLADGFMASYGFVPSPVAITVLGVAEACFQSVAGPGGYAAVARLVPDERLAAAQGWFAGAGTGSAGLAAVSGAPLYAALGPGAVFAGGAIASALLAVSAGVVGRRSPASAPGTLSQPGVSGGPGEAGGPGPQQGPGGDGGRPPDVTGTPPVVTGAPSPPAPG